MLPVALSRGVSTPHFNSTSVVVAPISIKYHFRTDAQAPNLPPLKGRIRLGSGLLSLGLVALGIALWYSQKEDKSSAENSEAALPESPECLRMKQLARRALEGEWEDLFTTQEEIEKIAHSLVSDPHSIYRHYVWALIERGHCSEEHERDFLVALVKHHHQNSATSLVIDQWIYLLYKRDLAKFMEFSRELKREGLQETLLQSSRLAGSRELTLMRPYFLAVL